MTQFATEAAGQSRRAGNIGIGREGLEPKAGEDSPAAEISGRHPPSTETMAGLRPVSPIASERVATGLNLPGYNHGIVFALDSGLAVANSAPLNAPP